MKKRAVAILALLSMAAILIAHHVFSETPEITAPEPARHAPSHASVRPPQVAEPSKTETIVAVVQEIGPKAPVQKYVLENMPAGSSIMPPPKFHPRPEGEWQGMLIDMTLRPMCETTVQCGRALSCREGHCLPCLNDRDCDVGEVCVLDHCVREDLALCRTRADCHQESLCVLTGYSEGPRGNTDMKAFCMEASGGRDPVANEWTQAADETSQQAAISQELSPAARAGIVSTKSRRIRPRRLPGLLNMAIV